MQVKRTGGAFAVLMLAAAAALGRASGAAAAVDDGTRCMLQAQRDYESCATKASFWFRALCELEYHDNVARCREAVKG